MAKTIGTGLARVTVAAPKRRIDVALPEHVAAAELLPGLLRRLRPRTPARPSGIPARPPA